MLKHEDEIRDSLNNLFSRYYYNWLITKDFNEIFLLICGIKSQRVGAKILLTKLDLFRNFYLDSDLYSKKLKNIKNRELISFHNEIFKSIKECYRITNEMSKILYSFVERNK